METGNGFDHFLFFYYRMQKRPGSKPRSFLFITFLVQNLLAYTTSIP